MFFVSDINGNLVPLSDHPQRPVTPVQPLGQGQPLIPEQVPSIGIIALTAAATDEATAIESAAPTASGSGVSEEIRVTAINEDAAIFEGHVIEADPSLQALPLDESATAVGLAAASTGYKSGSTEENDLENDYSSEVSQIQPVQPVAEARKFEGGLIPNKERVTPIPPIKQRTYSEPDQASERVPVVTADQIMTSPVVTLNEDNTIAEAWRIFREHRFRHLPVLSKAGKLIGILSDRDFIPKKLDPQSAASVEMDPNTETVRQRMASNILTARPETEVQTIARVMFEWRVGAMPIVNESGELVGILTRSDILRTIVGHTPLELWT